MTIDKYGGINFITNKTSIMHVGGPSITIVINYKRSSIITKNKKPLNQENPKVVKRKSKKFYWIFVEKSK